MSDRLDVREAYRVGAAWYVDTLRLVGPTQWDLPGLGEWSVRELAAHAGRAFSTVEQYLAEPGLVVEVPTATEYYEQMLGGAGGEPGAVHAAVAQRAREDAAALGDDPSGALTARVDRVLDLLATSSDDATFRTPAGVMPFADYLATRVVEVTVHTADLCAALGRAADVPEPAGCVTLRVLADLLAATGAGTVTASVIRALTGRGPLPAGFDAFPGA
ncbi:MAG: maleylpyruvate isomerase N-terminal domain-containing protein [Acidimicrobiales bacterium]|nr:maleylpyruvate isomerase N-terminal domain-containing protein [Acidimicrobiales bacterium]